MLTCLALPFALLALCSSPLPAPPPCPFDGQGQALTRADPFPPPREGFTIRGGSDSMRIAEMLDELTRVTGIAVQMTPQSRSIAEKAAVGLNRSVEVPASEVYRIVETLLRVNDLVVVHLSDAEPRMWSVVAVFAAGGRGEHLRTDALVVSEPELERWTDHPATLITTTIELPHTDVRTLSNSMRTMFTDANTQSVIPVGQSSLMITGFAREVHGLVRMLRRIDEAASVERNPLEAPAAVPVTPKRQ